ncbi:HAD hydrolase-like protein [Maricaulis sp. CAU 1757]
MLDSTEAALFDGAAIAFDLDGTLVDTAPDLVRALNAVTAPHGVPEIPVGDVRMMVGRGARALIERAFARHERPLEAGLTDQLVERFIDIYRDDVAARSLPFAGVEPTLAWMCERGAVLSVCTNKPSVLADLLLSQLGLEGYFARIIGPERTAAKKPAADHLHDALGRGYARAALVGDSLPDVESARAAGLPCIVMSYGYSENPADSLGADRVIHAFSDVPRTLASVWQAPASSRA